ncbi:hypothetical protein [Clostridium oryzae]|uniref:Uncharacterized protein n=1 Tax=Clostridium oryzae TaxID=1450648 RepID=A0A1V4INU8_9CLOT|nr:hypothetical protein [Clostridium oryzae]OPJ61514.1 hypothetical protein CLORY_21960 [Clostridium oryzae]
MALKKKKGSSMIMLLIIFALIVIFGTAILALTAADYSMRVVASEKIENFYAADSGICIIQGIVKKEVECAVVSGNEKAADYLKNDADTDKSILKKDGSTVDEDKLYAAANAKFKNAYKSYIVDFLNKRDEDNNITQGIYTGSDGKKDLFRNITSKPNIDIPSNAKFNEENRMDLKVISTFETAVKRGQTSNKKTVSAHIIITVPNYGDTYSITTKEGEVALNPVWQNAVSIDGNMNLNGQMEFDGDIFVRGINNMPREDLLKNISYNKYYGGISIGNDKSSNYADINFNNCKIVTANSFCINGSNNHVNSGDIYAGNLYVGSASKEAGEVSESNNIHCHNVYLSNDLCLNSEKTSIGIAQFYGINDVSSPRTTGVDNENYKSSSSIIVNSDDIGKGSAINIENKAIIMGTAYIDTKPEAYQTGEAVAIKGNYKTYGIHIPDDAANSGDQAAIDKYKQGNVNFAYINPLMLIKSLKSGSDSELTVQQKIEYFKLCQKLGLTANGTSIKSSGITLPGGSDSVISFGLSPQSGNNNFDTNYKAEDQKIVSEKQKQLAEKVYEMSAPEESYVTPADKLYAQGNQNRTVMDGDKNRVTDPSTGYQTNTVAQVAFVDEAGNYKTYDVKKIDYASSSVVYVNSEAKKVVLLGRGAQYDGDEKADNVIDLKNMNSSASSGVIVVKGDVELYGDIDFTGSIIAGGDFTTKDNIGVKKIRWDNSKVKQFIASNYNGLFKNIFINSTGSSSEGSTFSVDAGDDTVGYQIDDDVVKLSQWRMER